ncbi:MAG: response regulator [Myxococcaceae bacterium]|nr:response regulator [Myxococcaceae bacterium]
MPSRLVLVVDDDTDNRESLIELLTMEGYEAVGAKNGLDALQFLEKCERLPSVLLIDLMMPEMDGVALCQACAGTQRLSSIPRIIVSGKRDFDLAACQAHTFVTKPVSPARILTAVGDVLMPQ